MFSQKEKEIVRDGLALAARRIAYNTEFEPIERILLKTWRETVHDLLRENECGCTRGHDDECFLNLPHELQVESMADHRLLSLESFSDIVLDGLTAAIKPYEKEEAAAVVN